MDASLEGIRTALGDLSARVAALEALPNLVENVKTLRGDLNYLLESISQRVGMPVPDADRAEVPTHGRGRDVPMRSLIHQLEEADHPRHPSRPIRRYGITQSSKNRGCSRRQDSSPNSSMSDRNGYSSNSDASTTSTKSAPVLRTRERDHKGLKPFRASNPLVRKVVDYRYYRLRRPSHRHSRSGKVRDIIKRLTFTLRAHIFHGEDTVVVPDFPKRFVEQAAALGMNEIQAYLATIFPRRIPLEQYEAVPDAHTSIEGGVSCWPETVKSLLRSYATSKAIRGPIKDLRAVQQQSSENELAFSSRLNKAAIR